MYSTTYLLSQSNGGKLLTMTGARTTVVPVAAGTPGIVFGKNVTAPTSVLSGSASRSASVTSYSGGLYSSSSASSPTSESSGESASEKT